MAKLTLYSKWACVALVSAVLVACSSNETKEADEAAAQAVMAEQAAQEAATAREAERQRQYDAQRNLEQTANAAGTIFYFDFDSSTMSDEAREQVDAHIAALLGNNLSVRLEGHTDERGTREYNLALGERRANSIRDYMVVNGVPSYRIETVSFGEENPVAYGTGERNWRQNRRVELR